MGRVLRPWRDSMTASMDQRRPQQRPLAGLSARRKWTVAAVVLLLVGSASAMYVIHNSPGRDVVLHWDYDYAQTPPCGELTQRTCLLGFKLFVGWPDYRQEPVFVANRFLGTAVVGKGLEGTVHTDEVGLVRFCVMSIAKYPDGSLVESLPVCERRLIFPAWPAVAKVTSTGVRGRAPVANRTNGKSSWQGIN